MKKTVSKRSIELIVKYLPEIGVELPLKNEDDVDKICDFFEDMEASLANAAGCGEKIDRDLLCDASNAFDDLAIINDGDYHDLEELNAQLMRLM